MDLIRTVINNITDIPENNIGFPNNIEHIEQYYYNIVNIPTCGNVEIQELRCRLIGGIIIEYCKKHDCRNGININILKVIS